MRVSSFLRSCTKYLLNNLPFDNQIIKYAKIFQPSLQQSIAAPSALSGLTLSIAQVLGTDEMRRYFKLGSTAAKFNLCDVVKKEFREYQTWKVEDKKDEESHEKKRRLQYSNWKYAYGLFTVYKDDDYCLRCDAFHSTRKNRSNKNYLKNIDIIYAFLFLLFIFHGTYVLAWNNLLSK